MVTNNHSFEEQGRRSLAEVQSRLKAAEVERDKLNADIVELTRIAQAYELVLGHQSRLVGKEHVLGPDWSKILEGKARKEQLMTIAKHKGGKIRVSEATDILYTMGFIKSKRRGNAYTIVYDNISTMADEGLLEKVDPGEFKIATRHQLSLPHVPRDDMF